MYRVLYVKIPRYRVSIYAIPIAVLAESNYRNTRHWPLSHFQLPADGFAPGIVHLLRARS